MLGGIVGDVTGSGKDMGLAGREDYIFTLVAMWVKSNVQAGNCAAGAVV